MTKKRIALFASGSGSNVQALLEACRSGELHAEPVLLICDKPEAKVVERAAEASLPTFTFQPKMYENKEAFEKEILQKLQQQNVDYIILAGYMRLVGSTLLQAYEGKIINIHPSLLPDFPGLDAIGQAIEAKTEVTGVTVHFVDEGMDTGPIIAQQQVEVLQEDTRESLQLKIQQVEHILYPKTLQKIFQTKEGVKPIMRALVSVSNKEGIVPFVKRLVELGVEVISTGGTKKSLQDAGVNVIGISEVTGFPEILDGRVKTLHPMIHGGLLAMRGNESHEAQLQEHNITPIDLVIVNLYPFKETIAKEGTTFEDAIENIDIGGPTMLRSAAKNHQHVTVVVDPVDYEEVATSLESEGKVSLATRQRLAAKVFRHTAAYDAMISNYLSASVGEENPESLTITFEKVQDLRYGENPHQKAAFYKTPFEKPYSIASAKQLHGKELSYNNINDADAAIQIVKEFTQPAAVAIKHTNPCGVGVGETALEAYERAYKADPTSIFGGIVAFNREVDKDTALLLHEIFLEIIIAPSFSAEALDVLKQKKNIRLLTVEFTANSEVEMKYSTVTGGLLVQEEDTLSFDEEKVTIPTKRQPTDQEWEDLRLAWKVVKHVKSNAIVLAKDNNTVGVGAGQMNRVGAAKIAIEQAGELAKGSALGSDAFFPMDDTVEAAAKAGVTAIIQPGGSIRDEDSIKKADEHGITMVFTGVRHFKH